MRVCPRFAATRVSGDTEPFIGVRDIQILLKPGLEAGAPAQYRVGGYVSGCEHAFASLTWDSCLLMEGSGRVGADVCVERCLLWHLSAA